MTLRKKRFEPLAFRMCEKWNVVEQKVMDSGLGEMQKSSRLLGSHAIAHGKMPLTDSGYASGPRPNNSPNVLIAGQNVEIEGLPPCLPSRKSQEDDSMTLISTVKTDMAGFVQQCLHDICHDMHDKIAPHIHHESWKSMSRYLSQTLKAFAIKFGLSHTQSLNHEIMHFIYRHHR